MIKRSLISCLIAAPLCYSSSVFAYDFFKTDGSYKKFSVSAGWLHAMPQGKANDVSVDTAAKAGTYQVGDIQLDTVNDAIAATSAGESARKNLNSIADLGKVIGLIKDDTLTADMSGSVKIDSLEHWSNPNTGLEADDVDTLGLMFNYHMSDNWSIEVKAGVPPKVDIQGKGQVYAPLQAVATPKGNVKTNVPLINGLTDKVINGLIDGIGDIPLDKQIFITDLTQGDSAATTTAWLPAVELHYQFGKSGVNKLRPYVGVGVMYAYFSNVELNSGIEQDLIAAGHMIRNVLDGKAGAALEGKTSSADPRVKVKADDAFAPIVTLGATYDFNDHWFAVGSVSYSKLNTDANITVTDNNTGVELIKATSKIDVDPIITYAGIGYRF